MTDDAATLRDLALAAGADMRWPFDKDTLLEFQFHPAYAQWFGEASPDVVLRLLDDNQRLRDALERMRHTHYGHEGVVVTHTGPEHLASFNEACDICAALTGPRP